LKRGGPKKGGGGKTYKNRRQKEKTIFRGCHGDERLLGQQGGVVKKGGEKKIWLKRGRGTAEKGVII